MNLPIRLLTFSCILVFVSCKKRIEEPMPADYVQTSSPAPEPMPSAEPPVPVRDEHPVTKAWKFWDEIRNNEDKYLNKEVRFERMKIYSIYDEYVFAQPSVLKPVRITGNLGKIHEDDWIDITAVFKGVTSDGELKLVAKKVKNLGYHSEW